MEYLDVSYRVGKFVDVAYFSTTSMNVGNPPSINRAIPLQFRGILLRSMNIFGRCGPLVSGCASNAGGKDVESYGICASLERRQTQ